MLLLALAIISIINAPVDWRGAKPMMSSYLIVVMAISLFVILPAIPIAMRGSYIWAPGYFSEENLSAAIWLSILALTMFILGNAVYRRYRPGKQPEQNCDSVHVNDSPPRQNATLLLVAFLFIGVAIKIFLVLSVGGPANSVFMLSSLGRSQSGIDTLDSGAIILRVLSGVADGAAVWGLLNAFRERRNEKTWGIVFLIILSLTFLTIGKRLILLLPILMVVVGIHVYKRPLTIKLLPAMVIGTVLLGLATISLRAILPALLLGYDVDFSRSEYAEGSFLRYYLYSLEFAMLEMITVVMVSRESISGMFGGAWEGFWSTNIEPLFYTVPRAIWPGKPAIFYDLSYGVSAELGVSDFENPTVGFAPTIIGTSYFFLGIAGVALAMFGLGALSAQLDRRLLRGQWGNPDIFLYAIGLVIMFHLFRQGSIGYALIISITQQYGAIAALLTLSLVDIVDRRGKATSLATPREEYALAERQ